MNWNFAWWWFGVAVTYMGGSFLYNFGIVDVFVLVRFGFTQRGVTQICRSQIVRGFEKINGFIFVVGYFGVSAFTVMIKASLSGAKGSPWVDGCSAATGDSEEIGIGSNLVGDGGE